MNVACLVVAGATHVLLAAGDVSLAWSHSVQKTRWEERYRVEGEALRLVEAFVEGSGAGMEAPPQARRDGAGWRWSPDRVIASVALAASPHGGDYEVCDRDGCRPLRARVGDSAGPVELRACPLRR